MLGSPAFTQSETRHWRILSRASPVSPSLTGTMSLLFRNRPEGTGKSLIRRQLWLVEVMAATYSGGLVDGVYVSKV